MSAKFSICKRFYVSGRVQGVFYRATAAAKARQLGVTGHARNLRDGRVEVLACGERTAVDELGEWLWEGPGGARVTNVSATTEQIAESELPPSFSTR